MALQAWTVVVAGSRCHRKKVVGQETIVSSPCCGQRGTRGRRRSMGIGQQSSWVLIRWKATSYWVGAEAQEGLAACGDQRVLWLHHGQLMTVERGLELCGREAGQACGVLSRAGELVGAEGTPRGPAAPQQGQGGFGAALHPWTFCRRLAVQKTKRPQGNVRYIEAPQNQ